MIALRVVLAGLVSALALAPALASDNSKSHIDPDIKVYGHADQMSVSDQSSDPTSDDQQVASVLGPPNPNDPNYVQELQDQLKAQQQALSQAQSALKQLQAQLASAQALLPNVVNYQSTASTAIAAAQKAYNTTRTNFINGTATQAALEQAENAFAGAASAYGFSIKDNNNGATNIPLYVIDQTPYGVAESSNVNLQNVVQNEILGLTVTIQWAQVEVTRLQASVTSTKALITAAQNGQPPSNQTSDATTDTTDTASVSDPSNVANVSIDGGGGADGGDD